MSLIVSANVVYGQSIIEKHPNIQSSKDRIDKDTTLRTITLSNEEFLEHVDQGGECVGYYRDSILVKVNVVLYYNHGVDRVKYYVTDGKLFLMEETFDMYPYNEDLNEFDYSKTEINFHGQYVFKDYKLIDQISTGHNRFEDDTIDIKQTVLNEIHFYMDLIARKNAQ